mmetsp:Transcript_10317/g.21794  ORF Transcript_10317/g.21794 Transcript_10317/m.21794 type:complete len:393 (+) Transcript_10317:105-1283(+)
MNNNLKYVDHTYRDFSRYVEDGGVLVRHKKSGNNFPARLHQILSEPTHSDVITWMPHGRAWKIIDKKRLVEEVLPGYYVCKKYESFSRQLNGWGFKRLHQHGPDFGCYYHESFLRGLPKLTCLIRRLPANLGKFTPFAEGEPDFYKMAERYPLLSSPKKSSATAPTTEEESSGRARATTSDSSSPLAVVSLVHSGTPPSVVVPSIVSRELPIGIQDHLIQESDAALTHPTLSESTVAPLTTQQLLQMPSYNSHYEVGSHYHPPSSDRSFSLSRHPLYSSNHYYGSNYDQYPTKGQRYRYCPGIPPQPAVRVVSAEDQLLTASRQRSYSQESHISTDHRNSPLMASYSAGVASLLKSQDLCSKVSLPEQRNDADPFEPIPIHASAANNYDVIF